MRSVGRGQTAGPMPSAAVRLRGVAPGPRLLRGLCTLLHGLWVSLRRALHLGGTERHRGPDGCCHDLANIYRRPDPLLYSQHYLMSLGFAVTWDNPDIDVLAVDPNAPDGIGPLLPAGVELEPDHEYWVRVQVWNASFDAPIVGLPVELSFLSFGAGITSNPIDTRHVNLGVRGSPNSPSWAWFRWRTPSLVGHYCIQAALVCADDANPHNNLGQKNILIGDTHSPARVEFAVRNTTSQRRRIVFETDTYAIPPLEDCREPDRQRSPTWRDESAAGVVLARRRHTAERWPVPSSWTLELDPAEPVLDPGETATITVTVEPTWADPTAPATLNVHAFADGETTRVALGGVTLHIVQGRSG